MICAIGNTEFEGPGSICPHCSEDSVGAGVAAAPSTTADTSAVPPVMGTTLSCSEGDGDWRSTLTVSGSSSIRSRLHPRSTGEIFREVFTLYRDHARQLLALSMLVAAPWGIAVFVDRSPSGAVQRALVSPNSAHKLGVLTLLIALFLVLSWLGFFVMIRSASKIYLNQPLHLAEILRPGRRLWRYIQTNSLATLVVFGAAVLVAVGVMVGTMVAIMLVYQLTHPGAAPFKPGPTVSICVGATFLTLFVVVLLATDICFSVAGPAALIEGTRPVESLRRSLALIRGFFWKGACVEVLSLCISVCIQQAFRLGAGALHAAPLWRSVLAAVQSYLSFGLTLPISALAIVLFYYDLRVRKEGFDLQMLAQQLGRGQEADGPGE